MSGPELYHNHPEAARQIARAAHTHFDLDNSSCIARIRDGEVLAGVIFNNYVKGVAVHAHTAVFADRGISRDLLYVAMDYPFNQLKVKRIFGFVAECNVHAQVFNMKMGFKVVARIEGMFPHDDAALVMRLDREDARLLGTVKPRSNQKLN